MWPPSLKKEGKILHKNTTYVQINGGHFMPFASAGPLLWEGTWINVTPVPISV